MAKLVELPWQNFWTGARCSPPPPSSIYQNFEISTYLNIRKPLANNRIRASRVRLIDETGKNLGVVDLKEALRQAQERNLDLIQVTSKLEIPVCKIGDLGKYLYQLEKKEKSQKKEAKLKEIRIRYNTSPHDLEVRRKQTEKFLKQGNQVRIRMQLRGREKAFGGLAKEKTESFLEALGESVSFKTIQELKKQAGGLSVIIIKG